MSVGMAQAEKKGRIPFMTQLKRICETCIRTVEKVYRERLFVPHRGRYDVTCPRQARNRLLKMGVKG